MGISLPFALLCALCAVLAWIDIRDGIIPDWLNLTIAALGLIRIVMSADLAAALGALGEGVIIGGVFWLCGGYIFLIREFRGWGSSMSNSWLRQESGWGSQAFLWFCCLPR